jgi:ABC-type molybdenum transport system ATPase subunit/photorepair protein PhrA
VQQNNLNEKDDYFEEKTVTDSSASTPTHSMDLSGIVKADSESSLADEKVCIEVKNFNLYYGDKQALKNINLTIPDKSTYREFTIWWQLAFMVKH